jgi:hypothetical protein
MTLLSLSLSRPRQLFSSHYVHTDVEEKSAWTEKSSCWYIMKYTQNVIINFVVFLRCKAGKRNVFAISDGVRFFSFLCVYRFFVSTSRLLQKGSLYSHIKRYRPIAVPLYTLTIMQQALSLSLSRSLLLPAKENFLVCQILLVSHVGGGAKNRACLWPAAVAVGMFNTLV